MEPVVVQRRPNPCPTAGSPSTIVATTTRQADYPEHPGPLSVKCVFRGSELYELEGRTRIRLTAGSYLLLNHGSRYSGAVRSHEDVECLSIFFRPEFAEDVLGSLVTPGDRLLDDPGVRQPVAFFERLYPHDETMTPIVSRLRRAMAARPVDGGRLEERLHDLLEGLLRVHRGLGKEIDALPSVRRATRVELYRRLQRARDYVESNLASSVGLRDMAGIACLSPHHFLRLFKHLFRETPHQYLIRRRLERARELLERTGLPVTAICLAVGFESLGSFSSLFRRRVGHSPSGYRRLTLKVRARDLRHMCPPRE